MLMIMPMLMLLMLPDAHAHDAHDADVPVDFGHELSKALRPGSRQGHAISELRGEVLRADELALRQTTVVVNVGEGPNLLQLIFRERGVEKCLLCRLELQCQFSQVDIATLGLGKLGSSSNKSVEHGDVVLNIFVRGPLPLLGLVLGVVFLVVVFVVVAVVVLVALLLVRLLAFLLGCWEVAAGSEGLLARVGKSGLGSISPTDRPRRSGLGGIPTRPRRLNRTRSGSKRRPTTRLGSTSRTL
mmetsp:Transcript_39114/g.83249  ORF Transcript_39114/g.83249 Transcript_39114/m.83249 type:complete len:243 (-) Transcript_39114:1607-2335(-)